MTNNYIVTQERLRELLKAEDTLSRLEGAGVDNWDAGDAFDGMDDDLHESEGALPEAYMGNGISRY